MHFVEVEPPPKPVDPFAESSSESSDGWSICDRPFPFPEYSDPPVVTDPPPIGVPTPPTPTDPVPSPPREPAPPSPVSTTATVHAPHCVFERGNAKIFYRVSDKCKIAFYERSGNFVAECRGVHGTHSISRTSHDPIGAQLIKNPAQGRCVAGMIAWCEGATTPDCAEQYAHTMFVPDHKRRRDIRDRLKVAPAGSAAFNLLAEERAVRRVKPPIEADSEPELWQ